MFKAAPGWIAGQQRRDLRERKDEDEVEKELEWRDSLLALDRLRAHERTLTRFALRHTAEPLHSRIKELGAASLRRGAVRVHDDLFVAMVR